MLSLKVVKGYAFLLLAITTNSLFASEPLRIGKFVVDVTPPVGSPMAYNRCDAIGMPLTACGIVVVGNDQPIVLCAVDWIGISNEGYSRWKEVIAKTAGTTPERVTVHCLHQHDAPRCDFSADRLLAERGIGGVMFDVAFARDALQRVAEAAKHAADNAQIATHVGLGQAKIEKVASNRRILGKDGRVREMRYTATTDPKIRAEPEGVIDPYVKSISFWQDETPLVVVTYYATHPQSYYRTGVASADFPGIARFLRQTTLNGLTHVHFNGASGDIGAGKYNDGSHENRQTLAVRMADGMAKALAATEKHEITAQDVDWQAVPVKLPASKHMNEQELLAKLNDENQSKAIRAYAAKELTWLRRCESGDTIDLTCLTLGKARVVGLPGEAVIGYQLAAQKMRPDLFVAVAAYGDYAPGYICLKNQYGQGGYEDSARASKVAPEVEDVLVGGMKQLLGSNN